MLLTSTGVISRSQQEESVLLLRKIEELNKNTARLIVEAGKLIQESKQLSARVKSLETQLKCLPRNNDSVRPLRWVSEKVPNLTVRIVWLSGWGRCLRCSFPLRRHFSFDLIRLREDIPHRPGEPAAPNLRVVQRPSLALFCQ